MSELDFEAMLKKLQTSVTANRDAGRGPELDLETLKQAMAHPKAKEQIRAGMEIEAQSVAEGQAAPDFTLGLLAAPGGLPYEKITLSDHFGKRPVALIFGSYT